MPVEFDALFLKFEESRFFFSEQIYSFLEQLRKDIGAFLQANYNYRYKVKGAQNLSQNLEVQKMLLEEEGALLKLKTALHVVQQNLPKTFAHALEFPQLTSKNILSE